MVFQPPLQQVPGGGVAVGAVHHRGFIIDAGHLLQQGDVHAQAAAVGPGAGRAALEHRHGDPAPG
jgi:hypothetical protein